MNENEVCKRLDQVIRLLAVAMSDGKNIRQQIEMLDKAGFQPTDIAKVIGTTSNSVSVTLSQMRKRRTKPPSRQEGEE